MILVVTFTLPTTTTLPVAFTLAAALMLPVTLAVPVTASAPPVEILPPAMFPVATTCPAVTRFPLVTLPVATISPLVPKLPTLALPVVEMVFEPKFNLKLKNQKDTFRYTVNNTSVRELWGRSLIIHADEDDLGKGGFPDSAITGHSGARMACAILGRGLC